jgi:hypothetical protein
MHNAGMIYGYARVSTDAQDLTSQLAQLKAAGCEKVFREKITGQLEYSLSCLSSGNNKKKQNGESKVYQSKETIPEIRADKRGLGTKVCLP